MEEMMEVVGIEFLLAAAIAGAFVCELIRFAIHWYQERRGSADDVCPEFVLQIPDYKQMGIRTMADNLAALGNGSKLVSQFILWSEIAKIHPETKDGEWTLKFPSAVTAVVVKGTEVD